METNKIYLIYRFKNKINGKSYIGLTHKSLYERKKQHISESNKQKNDHFKFHYAIIKYGIDSFESEIMEENIQTLKEANEKEKFYINTFDSYKNGYNMTEGGGGRDKYIFSKESREKMKNSKLGTILKNETKEKISNALKGKHKTKEHNEKVRQSMFGKTHSAETKNKISEKLIGKNSGSENHSAIKINIFDDSGILIFECYGNFEDICKQNDLPKKALRRSYYNNGKPIYIGKTIKKEVLKNNSKFIGWYAIKNLS